MKKFIVASLLISSSLLFCGCKNQQDFNYIEAFDEATNTLVLDFSEFYTNPSLKTSSLSVNDDKKIMVPATYRTTTIENYLIVGNFDNNIVNYSKNQSIPNIAFSFEENITEKVGITFVNFLADSSLDCSCMLDLTGIKNAYINVFGNNYFMYNGIGTAIKANNLEIVGSEINRRSFNCVAQNQHGQASNCCEVNSLSINNIDVTLEGADAVMIKNYYNKINNENTNTNDVNTPDYTTADFPSVINGGLALKTSSISVENGKLSLYGGDGDRGVDADLITEGINSQGGKGGNSGYCISYNTSEPTVNGYENIFLYPGKGGDGGQGLEGREGEKGYDGRDAGFAHGSEGGGQGGDGGQGGQGGTGGDSLIIHNHEISNYSNIEHNLGGLGGKGGNGGRGGKGGQGGDSYGLIGAAPGGAGGNGGPGGIPGKNGTNSDGSVSPISNDSGRKGYKGEQGDQGYNWY